MAHKVDLPFLILSKHKKGQRLSYDIIPGLDTASPTPTQQFQTLTCSVKFSSLFSPQWRAQQNQNSATFKK